MKRRFRVQELEPSEARIESLSHEGRGIAHINSKTTFVEGALPGERVLLRYTRRRGRHDEGVAVEVYETSPERVEPRCPHFGVCGGGSLQHLHPEAQIRHKQAVLLEQLRHIGQVQPDTVLPPLLGPVWGYRRKARLSVKLVDKKGGVLVGFMEKGGRYVADIARCEVLHPRVGQLLTALRGLIGQLSIPRQVPQIDVAVGDEETALAFRHLVDFFAEDEQLLKAFAEDHGVTIYLQPGGYDTVHRFWPAGEEMLTYRLAPHGVEVQFTPADFVQVNAEINRGMVDRVLALLAPGPEERVLDLFCGVGNFTLPLARHAAHVTGAEGDAALVERARANAVHNGLENTAFLVANLAGERIEGTFLHERYDHILLDPPRTGAIEVIRQLKFQGVKRLVYVSCNPATLARDAHALVHEKGLHLRAAGVMDMFPHTTHVESIALFEGGGTR